MEFLDSKLALFWIISTKNFLIQFLLVLNNIKKRNLKKNIKIKREYKRNLIIIRFQRIS